jgi:hypothetical protein
MDTINKDTKQAATSATTSTSAPGAVHAGVSSMKGKQAFQKTNLTSGPLYYPEDDEEQQLAARRRLEQESVSNERAADAKSRNEKAEAKLKQEGKAKKQRITDEKLKRAARSDRHQENRRERVVARTTGEVTKSPTKSVSPSQEQAKHYHEDKDVENPGAVRVAGMNSVDSPAVQEDDLTMEIEDSTSCMGGMNEAIPRTRMLLEAQLVVEEDTERVAQQERENIEELRQQFIGEMGQVAQAEVVEDDGSKPRRRRILICATIVVILAAIILGVVLGTRDNTSPKSLNTISMVDNDSCDNSFGPINRAGFIPGSTSNGATVDIEAPSCGSASEPTAPGVWYNITGDGGNITLSTCSTKTDFDSQISVFTGSCDQLTCVDVIDNACGSQSRLQFESIQNEPYHILVHGLGNSSGSFDLRIVFTRLFVALSNLFVKYNVSIEALEDISSPQYKALEWMVDRDSSTLQSTLSDDELLERFALVLLYVATGGESWLDQAGFLTPLNTCSWNSIVDGPKVLGVGCNGEGSVVTLDLCKFPKSST